MGYYINFLPNGELLNALGKVNKLLTIKGAKKLERCPTEWEEDLVCVVDNGVFEAAGYCYNQLELEAFQEPDDFRQKTWLKIPNAKSLTTFPKD